jgi:hypothetical protein
MIRRRRCERGLGAAALVGALTLAGPARAQDARVAAEGLFKIAHDLVDKGDWDGGCPKFEASAKLFASASTTINIARCQAHAGRVASAWATYGRALALVPETQGAERQRALDEVAKRERGALELRLPRLRVVIADPPPGVTITRDGAALAVAALGEPLPADPGPHELVVSAPGHRTETRTVKLVEKETTTVAIALQPEEAPSPAVAKPAPPPSPGVPAWAWITGAGGLALSGVAVGFLVDELRASAALRNNCYSDAAGTGCRPTFDVAGANARKDRGFGLFVGLGAAGLAALGVATYGVVSGSRAPTGGAALAPWIAPGSAGLVAAGRF